MNHYKGPIAPELRIVPKGDGEFLLITNEGQGEQATQHFWPEVAILVEEFTVRHYDYKPNVPLEA